ncbi:MAG: glycosyltransferase family 4 protein [Acidobacteria bacterium]|nr:glycosyltransferase family 4 protein [Acidobacteriota bacterium]
MAKKQITICALMLDPYDMNPGQRFRLEQWEPYLNQLGFTVDYFAFTDDRLREVLYKDGNIIRKIFGMARAVFRRRKQVRDVSKYDVVYLFRTASMIGPARIERSLSKSGIPLIYDFDDAIYLTNTSNANRRFGWLKFAGKTAEICKLSDAVTVGNSHLAKFANKYNENVYVVPTSIDTDRYQPKEGKANETSQIVIGWTGSSTSQYHLEAFEPVLAELMKRRSNIEIRVISDREPSFTRVPYSWREWSSEAEIDLTAEIDIGIMPTPDDEWSRGKCAAKALQYMALGIPAICTDMGANRDVIDHGVNGFLASTEEQWLECFDKLIDDKELRRKMGVNARKTVVDSYSMTRSAKLFADVVCKTIKT